MLLDCELGSRSVELTREEEGKENVSNKYKFWGLDKSVTDPELPMSLYLLSHLPSRLLNSVVAVAMTPN